MDYYAEGQTEAVLDALGVDIRSETSDHWLIFCPYHDNWRTPAGEVDKVKGLFFCFGCGTSSDFVQLVMMLGKKTYFEAVRLIRSKATPMDITEDIDKSLSVGEVEEFDTELVDRLNLAVVSDRATNYFNSREINKESLDKFKLGYSSNHDMVIVPVHDVDGITMGFVGRSIEGKRFKNSTGLKKSKTLFNVHRVKSSPYVFVVESSFDAIRLDQEGLPAVATLGAGLSKIQSAILDKYFNTVYYLPDADLAGKEMGAKLTSKLGSKVAIINLPQGSKDVGDLSGEQIIKLKTHVDNPLVGLL